MLNMGSAQNSDHIGVTPEFGENSTLRKLFEF